MDKLEKVINALGRCESYGYCEDKQCPYYECTGCLDLLRKDALSLLKSQQARIAELEAAQTPRVMTLEEVVTHYSLPPVFPDDFGMQCDYYQDIQPLYFDFPHPEDRWIVHWRGYDQVGKYLDDWKPEYGKTWRCWTSRPTDEQREEAKWNEAD